MEIPGERNESSRVGIIQPNYIPWRGYFDFIRQVDTFIFLDDVQYTKRDWRNRNKVCTRDGGPVWLSVPVKANRHSLIMDVKVDYSENWQYKHINTVRHSYGKAPFFEKYFDPFQEILLSNVPFLSELDIALTKLVCSWLGVKTHFYKSSELSCEGTKDKKLIKLMNKVGGSHYLSGPAAKSYLQPELWSEAGIALSFITYPDYPTYPQIAKPFEPAVSVLDLMFMVGPDAPDYIWGSHFENKANAKHD